MPTPSDPLDSPPQSHGYLNYPVRNVLTSAFRRLSSDRFASKSGSSSRTSSQTRTSKLRRNQSYEDDFQDFQEGNLIDFEDTDTASSTKPDLLRPDPYPQSIFNNPAKSLNSSYEPSPRISPSPSPFQPPPLTPLVLAGSSSTSCVLTKLLAEEIRLLLPSRLQLVDSWRLTFSLERDGASLATLFDKCEEYDGRRGGFILVVKDGSRNTFGAYLSDPPHPSKGHYYGNGECFLWRCSILQSISIPSLASLPPPPSADTTNATRMTTLGSPKNSISGGTSGAAVQTIDSAPFESTESGTSTPERIRFKAFPYSGMNDYMIFCEHGFLSVGGGDGHYGLWLDSSLEKGVSNSCPTFGNEPLSEEGIKFEILDVEIWYLGA